MLNRPGQKKIREMELVSKGKEQMVELKKYGIDTPEEILAIAAIQEGKKMLCAATGLTKKELETVLEEFGKKLPEQIATRYSRSSAIEYPLGALEEPETEESEKPGYGYYEAMVQPETLPASINLINFMNPIRDQAFRGTCVSFACTALNEYYRRRVKKGISDLSEQHLYWLCKQNDGVPNAEGTYVSVGMNMLVQNGQCTEQCWPYNPNPPTNQPGPAPACAPQQAPNYKIPNSIKIKEKSVNDIKTAVSLERAVVFSIPVYKSWHESQAVKDSGNITMPLPNDIIKGGHAMLFVGYQDDGNTPGGGYFILRNSWGESWGKNSPYGKGYGTLPYEYMSQYGKSAYTIEFASQPICPPGPISPCPPRPFCPPGPIPCPPSPIPPCPPRPFCPPGPIPCPPRPIPPCPPRPFCPPGPIPPCPPGPILRCPPRPFCPPGPIPPGPGPYEHYTYIPYSMEGYNYPTGEEYYAYPEDPYNLYAYTTFPYFTEGYNYPTGEEYYAYAEDPYNLYAYTPFPYFTEGYNYPTGEEYYAYPEKEPYSHPYTNPSGWCNNTEYTQGYENYPEGPFNPEIK